MSGVASRGVALLLLAWTLLPGAAHAQGRVFLVGVDGGSWNVIDPMVARGELPHLAAMMAEGVHAELATVEPLTSPVVWSSIATGRRPESHGVTDFFATALSLKVPTAFERLSAQGLRVGLYDYLMTWPPQHFAGGFAIPGWLRRDPSILPKDLWTRIDAEPWVNDYASLKRSEDYRRNALDELEHKPGRWLALVETFDLQVGAVSFYGPDAVGHRFWHGHFPDQYDPPIPADSGERRAMFEAMTGFDRALGRIRASLAPEDVLLVVSDHGFQAREPSTIWVAETEQALAASGLDPARDGFALLSSFGRVIFRIPLGDFDERDALTDRLAAFLRSWESTAGDPAFWTVEVLDVAPRPPGRERSFWNRLRQGIVRWLLSLLDVQVQGGAHAVVFALPRDGTLAPLWPDGRLRVDGREQPVSEAFGRQIFTGTHLPTAIFLAAGGAVAPLPERQQLSVLDVAPLLLHLAGSPLPDDLEGRLPEELLDPAALKARPPRRVPAAELPGLERFAPEDADSDAELIETLRRLGYVE